MWGFPKNFPLIARNLFLKLAKYEPCFRYNVNNSLSHPWITRINKQIPLTVIEDLLKKDKIKTFKEMLASIICFKQLKKYFNFKIINKKIGVNECIKSTKRKPKDRDRSRNPRIVQRNQKIRRKRRP